MSYKTEASWERNNTFKILVATDIHLGYGEKDPLRDQDTFITFEEILQLAVHYDVDFLLLGGDLFHEANPSPYCIHKCMDLLKRYCLGDKPVEIEFLSDQSINFKHLTNPIVNYEDPNLNVSLPIFSIHGNHDDPSGQKQVSALDIIASSGLINYFGRWTDLTNVNIYPLCMRKGSTKLSMYGLSHIKDERLGRLFLDKKVSMVRSPTDDWFNLLVLHQNRVARGPKNYIPSSVIPNFIKLVIWGHEHDCRIIPEEQTNGVFISQPGSSVATSLAIGESIPKHVGLLEICGTEFKLSPIPLKTVRPFFFDELVLENPDDGEYDAENPQEQAIEQIKVKLEELIKKAEEKHTNPNKKPPLPLIRLVVKFYEEKQQFNVIRLGQQFIGHIANPLDCIILKNFQVRQKTCSAKIGVDDDIFNGSKEGASKVEDIVVKYFENQKDLEPKVLSVQGLNEAVSRYVEHNEIDALSYLTNHQFNETLKKMVEMDPELEELNECIERLYQERIANAAAEAEGIKNILRNSSRQIETNVVNIISDDEDICVIEETSMSKATPSKSARGRSSRGRGSSRGRSSSRGRGAASDESSSGRGSSKRGRGKSKAPLIF